MARSLQFDFAEAGETRKHRWGLGMSRFATVTTLTVIPLLIFANSIMGQPESIYRLPVGMRIRLTVDAEINSKVASVNDTFVAAVAKPVLIRDAVVLPVGTLIEGRVSGVSRAASAGQVGKLDVVFESLRISNSARRIDGVMITRIAAKSSRKFTILSILGGIAAGAVVGAAKSGLGAVVGASVGAGAGAGLALLRTGKDVRIRKGEEFEIELRREVVLPVLDY